MISTSHFGLKSDSNCRPIVEMQVVRGIVIRKNNTQCLVQMDNEEKDLIFCERDVFTGDWADVRKDMGMTCEVILNDHPKAKWRATQATAMASAVQPSKTAPNNTQNAASTSTVSASTASLTSTLPSSSVSGLGADTDGRNRAFKLLWITAGIASNVLARVYLNSFKEKYNKTWDRSCVSMIDTEQLQRKVGQKGIQKIETQDPDMWDVTALAHLLVENKGFGNGLLGSGGTDAETTRLVLQVRAKRNEVVHDINEISSQITEENFQKFWGDVYECLNKLAAQVCACACEWLCKVCL
jgi:hypothetical protein